MKVVRTAIEGVLSFEPKVFGDERGFFFESFNERTFHEAVGHPVRFVQDNHSRSAHHVLRGLHYQLAHPQGKLVRVVSGTVFDVVVDLRRRSSTFGRWIGVTLSAETKQQLWVPEGCAHGFVVLSESADFLYKTTDYWYPDDERTIAWDDPHLAIEWPLERVPSLSKKDLAGTAFPDAEVYA